MKNMFVGKRVISFALAISIGLSIGSPLGAAGSDVLVSRKPSFASSMMARLKPDPFFTSLTLFSRFFLGPILKQSTTGGLVDRVQEPTQEKIKQKMQAIITRSYNDFKFWTPKFWASPGVINGLFLGAWTVLGGSLLKIPYIGLGIPLIGLVPNKIVSLMPEYTEEEDKEEKQTGIIARIHKNINWNIAIPACLIGGLLAYNFIRGKQMPSCGSCAMSMGSAVGMGALNSLVKPLLLEEINYVGDIDRRIARRINATYNCGECQGKGSKADPLLTVCVKDPEHVMHVSCALRFAKQKGISQLVCPFCQSDMDKRAAQYISHKIRKEWETYATEHTDICSICKKTSAPNFPVVKVMDTQKTQVLYYAHEHCFAQQRASDKVELPVFDREDCTNEIDNDYPQGLAQDISDQRKQDRVTHRVTIIEEDNDNEESVVFDHVVSPGQRDSYSLQRPHRSNMSRKVSFRHACFGCGKGHDQRNLVSACSQEKRHRYCMDCLHRSLVEKKSACRCGSAFKPATMATIMSTL